MASLDCCCICETLCDPICEEACDVPLCSIISKLLFFIGIPILFFVTLYGNPHNPAFSVEEFYVPAFNKTANNATTQAISFNIKLQNQNSEIGLYYVNSVNVSFSYTSSQTNDTFIWQYSVPKFYQGNAQSRRLVDEIQMHGNNVSGWNQMVVAEQAWFQSSQPVTLLLQPLQIFRVNIITKVRFKLTGNHHRKVLVVSALVPIDPNTGEMFTKDGIMTSVAPGIGWNVAQVAVLVASIAISAIFI